MDKTREDLGFEAGQLPDGPLAKLNMTVKATGEITIKGEGEENSRSVRTIRQADDTLAEPSASVWTNG